MAIDSRITGICIQHVRDEDKSSGRMLSIAGLIDVRFEMNICWVKPCLQFSFFEDKRYGSGRVVASDLRPIYQRFLEFFHL